MKQLTTELFQNIQTAHKAHYKRKKKKLQQKNNPNKKWMET